MSGVNRRGLWPVLPLAAIFLLLGGLSPVAEAAKGKPAATGNAASSGGDAIEVEAYGEGAILNGDTTRARDEAKRSVYRDAVEKGIGAYVESVSEMKEFQVVKDRVFSQARGIVKDLKVTKEEVGSDDILRLHAKCTVSVAALDGVLGPAVIDALGNPRVMIVVDEAIDGQKPFLSTVEGTTLALFQKAGYLMVDQEQAMSLHKSEWDMAERTGDMDRLKELAKTFQADVIIHAKAQSVTYTTQHAAGQKLWGVRSQLQLKAVITQTGYVLGSEIPEVKQIGVSAQDGAVKGLKIAAEKASSGLVNKVAYSLVSGSAGGVTGRVVKLFADGVSFADARRLKSALEETKGVTAVYQRSFRNNKLELDVNTEGNAEDLAVRLEELGMSVTGVTAGTIEATPGASGAKTTP